MMNEYRIDYKVTVTSVPDALIPPLDRECSHLAVTSDLYHFCVSSRLIWPVRMIDESDRVWIEIERMDSDGAQFHSLALDEGTYQKIDSDSYPITRE